VLWDTLYLQQLKIHFYATEVSEKRQPALKMAHPFETVSGHPSKQTLDITFF
jgi:hypothetical protein